MNEDKIDFANNLSDKGEYFKAYRWYEEAAIDDSEAQYVFGWLILLWYAYM